MSNLRAHAWLEFKAAGWLDDKDQFKDEMQGMICSHVLKLLDVFADEGHSGTTAPYTIALFKTLASFDPIVPLTGEDWEWSDVSDRGGRNGGKLWQNKRCSRVFKDDSGAYDIDGIVFYDWVERPLEEDEAGYPGITRFKSHYTSRDSRVNVEFPYIPKTEYVESPNIDTKE